MIQLSLDSEQRVHAEAEPAITWGNGYGLYCYHGVTLPLEFRLRWQGAPSWKTVIRAKKLVKFASAARE